MLIPLGIIEHYLGSLGSLEWSSMEKYHVLDPQETIDPSIAMNNTLEHDT